MVTAKMSDMWERFERGLRRSVLRHSITPHALLYQGLLLAALVLLVWEIASNVVANSERIGTTLGFGFLDDISGFGISFRLVPYELSVSTYFTVFLIGLLNTALVAFIGIALASTLGLAVGLLRLSSNWLLSRLAFFYVESVRGVPLLLQIMFWHFAVFLSAPSMRESLSFGDAVFVNLAGIFVPQPVTEPGFAVILVIFFLLAVGWFIARRQAKKHQIATGQRRLVWPFGLAAIILLPTIAFFIMGEPISLIYPEMGRFQLQGGIAVPIEFFSLLFALSIYTSSFIAEIVRAGVVGVPYGQTEAGRSLGLKPVLTLSHIVLPQALRIIVPPLISQYLNLTKNSSLAVAIGYPDLVNVFAGTAMGQTGKAVEIIAMTMAVYLSFSIVISVGMNWYNRRIKLSER